MVSLKTVVSGRFGPGVVFATGNGYGPSLQTGEWTGRSSGRAIPGCVCPSLRGVAIPVGEPAGCAAAGLLHRQLSAGVRSPTHRLLLAATVWPHFVPNAAYKRIRLVTSVWAKTGRGTHERRSVPDARRGLLHDDGHILRSEQSSVVSERANHVGSGLRESRSCLPPVAFGHGRHDKAG